MEQPSAPDIFEPFVELYQTDYQKRTGAFPTADLNSAAIVMSSLSATAQLIHNLNRARGWWTDLHTGQPLQRNVGELLMLTVSELSEAMEGHRKGLMDDKLLRRPMFEVELADCFIRLLDMATGLGFDLPGAVVEKLQYNFTRADHDPANRKQPNGKKY